MFCKNCGTQLNDSAAFCRNCGCPSDIRTDSNNQSKSAGQNTSNNQDKKPENSQKSNEINKNNPKNTASAHIGTHFDSPKPQPKKRSSVLIVIIISLTLLLVAIAGVLGYCYANRIWLFREPGIELVSISDNEEISNDENTVEDVINDSDSDEEENSGEETNPEEDIDIADDTDNEKIDIDELNNFINYQSGYGDVAVAVIDNLTGTKYESSYSDYAFSAWGFYLPIYMVSPGNTGILSNNPSTCNVSANAVIDAFGGTDGITDYLQSAYSLSITSYGRKFGDVKSSNDNYTCASEAAKLLNLFNESGNYDMLCYNYSSFGISAPSGATIYSQAGTENISKKENLNLFAIVKGTNCDYSIAILTRGGNSHMISSILSTVHSQMEVE